jgi:hypothetical protein
MRVRFLAVEKSVIVGILATLESKVKERGLRRRLALIKSKFLSTATFLNIKKGDLIIVQKLVGVALDQARKLDLTGERIEDIKLVEATLTSTLKEEPDAVANG